jgi:crotonobetainyl-CoA:carnitine CoA-transferase CaiB-like acyl-CoA transferase
LARDSRFISYAPIFFFDLNNLSTEESVMDASRSGPLAGVRVLDCGTAIVGPWSATLLAFLGADAIKVERPSGEITRLARPRQKGWSTAYTVANLGKRSIELDFKDTANRPAIERLLQQADAIIENYRPGVSDRIGIGYAQAKTLNPGIVYGSSSGWGDTGPMRDMSAVDSHLQAFSGFASLNGSPGGAPEMLRYTHIDPSGGTFLAAGVLLGLIGKQRFGQGAHIVTSHLAMTLAMQASRVAETLGTGTPVPRMGSACSASAPNQCFLTQDRTYIAITAQTQTQWAALCDVTGLPDLCDDPRFKTNRDRVSNSEALTALIGDKIKQAPLRWWSVQLSQAQVPASALFDAETLFHHAHIRDNDYLVQVSPDHTGPMMFGGLPWVFSKTPASMAGPTPAPGTDTDAVMKSGFGSDHDTSAQAQDNLTAQLPLSGLRVVELCQGYAGPNVGLLLAEVGASVTKVELSGGDWARDLAPAGPSGSSEIFDALNRNKAIVTLDSQNPADRKEIVALIAAADIVLMDWSPDRDDPVAALVDSAQHEKLITLSLSYYGENGALASQPGSELTVQAMTGYLRALGKLDGEPVRVGADIAESAAAGMGLLGVLAALYHRENTGEGQQVLVSRLGATMSLRSLQWAAVSNPDEWLGPSYCLAETDPPRHGYRTKDNNIFVSMMNLRDESSFTAMLKDLNMFEDVSGNTRFIEEGRTTIGMGYLSGEFHELWETYLTRVPSQEALDIFNDNGATAVAFPELDQLMRHPQVEALGLVQEKNGRRFLRGPWRGPWQNPDLDIAEDDGALPRAAEG